ncbi:hypothetical protein KZZ52_32405 [Dactylosporangium sp. AC04546]|uniref:hypothetical protein n=1 Tax=Dactylosporangium sp. AC04546 TaxID=2862460 RepID=UPI001EDC9C3D|nr:hypothetical protein [Dactylosporangium sp. AC04546]WVK78694.1 hypothetical protein KZZ52_32405 [Dactylosporangium sp. AC04546]
MTTLVRTAGRLAAFVPPGVLVPGRQLPWAGLASAVAVAVVAAVAAARARLTST